MPTKLTKDAILKTQDVATEWFEVPEWGGTVPLRALDAWAVSEYQNGLLQVEPDGKGGVRTKTDMVGATVRLCALGIADEDGPWFTVAELKNKSAKAINRIAERLRVISGLDADAIEEAEGN